MKHLFITLTAALFLFACGNEADSKGNCEEKCKKENCEHGSEKCKKDCAEKCEHKKDKKHSKKHGKKKEGKMMAIGTMNPSLETKLKDISGVEMHIEELRKNNGTLIIFSCNTCPFVVGNGEKAEGWENRYNDIAALANEKEIGFALINSNEAKRDGVDSFDEMVKHAKEAGYTDIKYLMDTDHKMADAFNARTTPHVYLFDSEHNLVYTGAIDDNVKKKEEVKEHWLSDAMTALAAGEEIKKSVSEHMGCSIKRVKTEKHTNH